ncbi:MAG: hypothetical protein K2X55_01050 [Burkholderiaceae bacterium]|nr:hypothetical protein [Burkholderiaceae bacterium]
MVAIHRVEVRMVQQEPLDVCLAVWLEWQRKRTLNLGWHRRSAGLCSDACADSDDLYDSMDTAAAEAVEAMMASLPRHLDWALRKACGIATVWRFPQLDFAAELVNARMLLETKLKKNIATQSFFL